MYPLLVATDAECAISAATAKPSQIQSAPFKPTPGVYSTTT